MPATLLQSSKQEQCCAWAPGVLLPGDISEVTPLVFAVTAVCCILFAVPHHKHDFWRWGNRQMTCGDRCVSCGVSVCRPLLGSTHFCEDDVYHHSPSECKRLRLVLSCYIPTTRHTVIPRLDFKLTYADVLPPVAKTICVRAAGLFSFENRIRIPQGFLEHTISKVNLKE
jgi:hypothetical protein